MKEDDFIPSGDGGLEVVFVAERFQSPIKGFYVAPDGRAHQFVSLLKQAVVGGRP